MNRVAGKHATLRGHHDTAAEDWIEKGKGVTKKKETRRGAMAGVTAILTGNGILTSAAPCDETLLYPFIVLDGSLENSSQVLDPATREIFAFSDHADTDHVIMLRDMPEPAFVRNICHGGRAFVDAGLAFGTLIVSPDGDLVEIRAVSYTHLTL